MKKIPASYLNVFNIRSVNVKRKSIFNNKIRMRKKIDLNSSQIRNEWNYF